MPPVVRSRDGSTRESNPDERALIGGNAAAGIHHADHAGVAIHTERRRDLTRRWCVCYGVLPHLPQHLPESEGICLHGHWMLRDHHAAHQGELTVLMSFEPVAPFRMAGVQFRLTR